MPLTVKQRAFADAYIECGNATEAAKRAGYSPRTAYSIGNENLKKPEISAYISERIEAMEAAKIADAAEVMRFYTSVMRGEEKDQFGLDASLADRLNAGKELMKRHTAAGVTMPGAKKQEDDPLTRALKEEAAKLANQ